MRSIQSEIVVYCFPNTTALDSRSRGNTISFQTMPRHHFYNLYTTNNHELIITQAVWPISPQTASKAPPRPVHWCVQTFGCFQSHRTMAWAYYANNYTVELFVFIVGFWMVVDNAMVVVATPSLPQSILLLSNNDLPTAHHPTPSYRYYWRTSLRGGKFVPPTLIPPISFYYWRARCFKGTHSRRWWWRKG